MNRIIEKVYSIKPFKRLLIIKETSSGLHGIIKIYNKNTKKWDIAMSARWYYRDGDCTIYRVKEYFNFRSC